MSSRSQSHRSQNFRFSPSPRTVSPCEFSEAPIGTIKKASTKHQHIHKSIHQQPTKLWRVRGISDISFVQGLRGADATHPRGFTFEQGNVLYVLSSVLSRAMLVQVIMLRED